MRSCPLLEALRHALGPAPRVDLARRLAGLPAYDGRDRLLAPQREALDAHATTLRDGSFTWGCVVLANDALFRDGRPVLPGFVIHGVAGEPDVRLPMLDDVAEKVLALRGREPVPDGLQELAAAVNDDFCHRRGIVIPPRIAEGLALRLSVLAISPRHLPLPRLASRLVPLAVVGDGAAAAVVVPHALWPAELTYAWRAWAHAG